MVNFGIKVYFCHPCQTEYLYFKDNTCISTSIYISLNNKTYRWTRRKQPHLDDQLWYVACPGTPGKQENSGLKLLKSFPKHYTEVTPNNFYEKLSRWLPLL